MSIRTETCQIRGKVSRNLLYWKKPPKEYMWSGERSTKNSNHYQTRSRVDQKCGRKLVKPFRIEKLDSARKTERNLLHRSRWQRVFRNSEKTHEEHWKGQQPCQARWWTNNILVSRMRVQSQRLASKKISKPCMVVKWNLMNVRDSEQNLCSQKIHQDRTAGQGFISMTHYNLVHKFIPMPQTNTLSVHAACLWFDKMETWIAPVVLTPKASQWKQQRRMIGNRWRRKLASLKDTSSLEHHFRKFKTPTDHICREELMDSLKRQICHQKFVSFCSHGR